MSVSFRRLAANLLLRIRPEPSVSARDRIQLCALAMDEIREFARQFRADDEYLDAPLATMQRQRDLGCDLMDFVDPTMSLREFLDRTNTAFGSWLDELSRERPRRHEFAAAVQRNLFVDNDAGWEAYAAHIRKRISWFDAGVLPTRDPRSEQLR